MESLWAKQKGAVFSDISQSTVTTRQSYRVRYWFNTKIQLRKLKRPLLPTKFLPHPHQTTCPSTTQMNTKHPSAPFNLPHLPLSFKNVFSLLMCTSLLVYFQNYNRWSIQSAAEQVRHPWMVIYSQVVEWLKPTPSCPQPRWPAPSPAPASPKKKRKKRRFTPETCFQMEKVSEWKNFSSQRRGWPQQGGRGKVQAGCLPSPLPAPAAPRSSSLPQRARRR